MTTVNRDLPSEGITDHQHDDINKQTTNKSSVTETMRGLIVKKRGRPSKLELSKRKNNKGVKNLKAFFNKKFDENFSQLTCAIPSELSAGKEDFLKNQVSNTNNGGDGNTFNRSRKLTGLTESDKIDKCGEQTSHIDDEKCVMDKELKIILNAWGEKSNRPFRIA